MEMRGSSNYAAVVALPAVLFLVQLVGEHEWEPNPLVQLAILAAFVPLVGPWRRGKARRTPSSVPAPT